MKSPRVAPRWIRWTPILALGWLVVFEISSLAQVVCVETVDFVELDEVFEIDAAETTWLGTRTGRDHVYRLEVTGVDGAGMEVWTIGYESGSPCTYLVQNLGAAELSVGRASLDFTSDGWDVIGLTPSGAGVTETFSVLLEELAAAPHSGRGVVPVVAHAAGKRGTFFRSDLWLTNVSTEAVDLDFAFHPSGGGAPSAAAVTVEGNHTVTIEDVVATLFGLDAVTGSLHIDRVGGHVTVASRTYTGVPGASYGQFIPAERWNVSAGVMEPNYGGAQRTVLHLTDSDDFRSNVGFAEVIGLEAVLEVALFDGTGDRFGGGEVRVPPFGHVQLNDVFTSLAAPSREVAGMDVTVRNHARVFSYASVVDNNSSDPFYVPALAGPGWWPHTELLVPAVAHTPGAYGSLWRTDLRVLARAPNSRVWVEFVPTDGSETLFAPFQVDGEILAIDDVVGALGGSGSGALLLSCNEDIAATTRTYDVGAGGSYGQFIPALGPWASYSRSVVQGVRRSRHFRTNVGVVNAYSSWAEPVRLSLVSPTGVLLGSGMWILEPASHLQVNDIFAALHVPWAEGCRVDIELKDHDGSTAAVVAYASIIDNGSGDPYYIPAARMSRDPVHRLELDNRHNAILLDQLSEAVGFEALPQGVHSASVVGAGDLGGTARPLHVLCLYKNPAGDLRSSAVPVGGSIAGIGGGERFWCVIPDWGSLGDNSGQVEVRLTGGAEEAVLHLDARDNAVLFDTLLESVTAAWPASKAYEVQLSGDFGAPHLPPQPMFMYRNVTNGRLVVTTQVNESVFTNIDTDHQLVMALVDWIDRDDNSGTTVLEPACSTRSEACNSSITSRVTEGDCNRSPGGLYWYAERVSFAGTAGQVVDLTVTWLERSGGLTILDGPDGEVVAYSGEYSHDPSVIAGHVLDEDGEYVLWVMSNPYMEDRPYALDIVCSEP